MRTPTVLGLIPARGGSKSVPRKNLRPLAGRPLIAYTIETARGAASLDRLIVSTDDAEIAEMGRRYGAEVPFLRPAAFAQDDTPDLPVFQHALEWLGAHEGYRPDLIVHLRPTSPFRAAGDIDAAVHLLWSHPEADAVRSVCVPLQNPFKMWRIDNGTLRPLMGSLADALYNQPRQQLPPVYWQTGCVDVTRYETVMSKQSMTGSVILPLVMADQGVDLDTVEDFESAEAAMRRSTSPNVNENNRDN
jgi:N-acylneuraminate cytidylyltransferase